ncbi:MAG: hypothetical protein WAT71_05930 [Ignavibacteria bacterium]
MKSFKSIFRFLILIIPVITFYYSCSEDTITNSAEDYSSILITDENGVILGGDETDWCWKQCDTVSFPNLCNKVYPPYPNPSHGTMHFRFSIANDSTHFKMYILRSHTDTVNILNDYYIAGTYLMYYNTTTLGLPLGYYRVYCEMDNLRCFGDVKFE